MSAFSKPGVQQSFVLTLSKEDFQTCVIKSPGFEFIDRKFENPKSFRPSVWNLQWNGPKGALELCQDVLSQGSDYGRPHTYRIESFEDFEFEVQIIQVRSDRVQDGRLLMESTQTCPEKLWNALSLIWTYVNYGLLSEIQKSSTETCEFRVTLRAGNAIAVARRETLQRRPADDQLKKVRVQWDGLHRAKHPFDVLFAFPESNRQLWENADFLRAESDYWKDLLGSGFVESSLRNDTEDNAQESEGQMETEMEDDDGGASSTPSSAIRSCAVPVHRIVITEDIPQHYETFRAVLGWLRSTQIDFMALGTPTSGGAKTKEPKKQKKRRSRKSKSSRTRAPPKISSENVSADPADLPDESDEWSDSSASRDKKDSSTSSSACPRSVYRLADYLRLKPLRELAFEDIKEKITVDNVASEIFSSFTETYEEVHKFELDFAVRNWAKVKVTPAMKEVERRIANRDPEMQGVAATLYQISMRLTNV